MLLSCDLKVPHNVKVPIVHNDPSLIMNEVSLLQQDQFLKKSTKKMNNLTWNDHVMWPLTLSCDLKVRHNMKVPIVYLWSKFDYDWRELVQTGAVLKRLTKITNNLTSNDLVMWPLTLSCDLKVCHNVKASIVHLWSKFGYDWRELVRTGAILKRLTKTLTDTWTHGRTNRIWIAMCLHEHSFGQHKNPLKQRRYKCTAILHSQLYPSPIER